MNGLYLMYAIGVAFMYAMSDYTRLSDRVFAAFWWPVIFLNRAMGAMTLRIAIVGRRFKRWGKMFLIRNGLL